MTTFNERVNATHNDTAPMPHDKSGDFLSSDFRNSVVYTEEMYTDETAYADIIKERVFMENGAHYEVTSTLSKQRAIDIGIIATAAWLTHDKGLNEDRARRASKIGVDTVFISPQQNLNRRGHFHKSVQNIIAIADFMNTRADRDPDHLWGDGISRGGMHNIGGVAHAPMNGKEYIYSDVTVPCFPEGFDALRDLPQLPDLIASEFSAATAFIKLPVTAAAHYPRTLAFHPRMLFQHLKEVPTLLGGGVGEAAKHMPDDTFMHVTNYLGDIMGQGRRWEPIFAKYDNITVENFVGGGHLSLAAPRCQEKWQARTETIRDIIHDDPRIVQLGGTAMREAAHGSSSAFKHRPIAA